MGVFDRRPRHLLQLRSSCECSVRRTPKAGERSIAPRVLAPVDIARLGKTIAATVERVKESDPKTLRARIAELERQLAAKPPEVRVPELLAALGLRKP